MSTFSLRMVKRLDPITNLPYGIFISEKPTPRDGYLVKLVKLKVTAMKEGERLSNAGLDATTKHVSMWHCQDKQKANDCIDRVVKQWAENKKKHEAAVG